MLNKVIGSILAMTCCIAMSSVFAARPKPADLSDNCMPWPDFREMMAKKYPSGQLPSGMVRIDGETLVQNHITVLGMQFAQDGVSNYPVLDGIDPSFEIDRKQFIGGHNYVTHVNGKPIEELCDTKVEGITQGSLLALLTDGEPMRLEVMVTDEGNSHFEQILVTKRGKSLVYQAQGYPDFPLEIISKTLESRFARIVSLPEDAKQGRIPVRHIITVNDKSADHACWVPKFLEMIENIKVGQHVQVTIDTGNASVPVDLTKSEIVRSMRVQCSRIESGDGL